MGQTVLVLAKQNDDIYSLRLDDTGVSWDWDTLSYSGSLEESSFSLMPWPDGSGTPDFSGGTETFFGLAGGNANSGTFTNYYDNFSLEIPALSDPIPEPASILLFIFGLAGVACCRKRGEEKEHYTALLP